MGSLQGFCQWLEAQGFSVAIAQSTYLFPVLETIHVFAIALVVGSIAILDLRLIGVSLKGSAVTKLANAILPWSWFSFALAALAGSLMFASRATLYFSNIPFRWKITFVLLAGLNMMVFHLTVFRRVQDWDSKLPPPHAARIAGLLSLTVWISVVFFGRFAGFVEPT
ncbi:MAG TPA: DUF6644 family protein [Steroidobacteraceae bacterium]